VKVHIVMKLLLRS